MGKLLQITERLYGTRDVSLPRPTGPYRVTPLPGVVAGAQLIEQDYLVRHGYIPDWDVFSAPPRSHEVIRDAYLVGLSESVPLGRILELNVFTATYIRIPGLAAGTASRVDVSTEAVQLIGYAEDYYLPGVTSGISEISDIPIESAWRPVIPQASYTAGGNTVEIAERDAKYLTDLENVFTDFASTIDAINSDLGRWPTSPTLTAYRGYITDGTQLILEDSSIESWRGNIHIRKTKRYRAQ